MTRRLPRRGATVVAAMIAAMAVLPLSVTTAAAAGCIHTDYVKWYTNGYARTTDANGLCSTVGANAGFTVSGTSSTIWTGWVTDPNAAQTPTVSYLVGRQHSGV